MSLFDMMSGLTQLQTMAGPAMQEISDTKQMMAEGVRLQREILQAIIVQTNVLKEVLSCLKQSPTLEPQQMPGAYLRQWEP